MAALVIVALFWGNCLSCPQLLLAMQAHQPAHDCCKRNQKPAAKSCDSRGLQHFLKTDPGTQAQLAPVASAVVVALPAEAPQAAAAIFEAPAHAPPDLRSLHSSFRI